MVYFLLSLIIVAIDQLTKKMAVDHLIGQGPQPLIDGFLGLRYIENRGAAFSILNNKQLLLILVTFVILGLIVGLLVKAIMNHSMIIVKISYALIIAGALGNFIDRIRLNYVVDFLEFRFIKFPIFNVADVSVVSGVILLVIATIFFKYEL